MSYLVEVKTSLKKGMLNPEASTIQKALALLNFDVYDAQTSNIIKFKMDAESKEDVEAQVDEMCQKLLCNPVIHDYEITVCEE
ncbi:MAG: phosphoribosylformylglycinamidine synthase subunit PurS [Methanosphaera sp.]|uniref:phosphoribosylformylglycinamidine synthase subunit PurS n=1 Tax=Methanosphaera sp. TaxID=2666342 RepID=UPI0025F9C4BB|nr:phosphoribosylformylglycinamidine synthase subunit PurS [Methanosphaera sp.]MCI5867306.1 phosphoribosylformylglycinamidine synthase subunit PurS [Methanosphaera sp.]MDD6534626.1 phosphoribosylformylglycinamidine synthase subunit PurS [Methanosphaera sp.]MDY3955706.1 phosphoribosylformylglycinamidine synthase subunit PurS [Methanosphaera sp.]